MNITLDDLIANANKRHEIHKDHKTSRPLSKDYDMMISLRPRAGADTFYLNVGLIEAIIKREGNTSEIRLTNGKIYTSIESPEQLANRVTRAQMSSELAKPKEGIYANSLR